MGKEGIAGFNKEFVEKAQEILKEWTESSNKMKDALKLLNNISKQSLKNSSILCLTLAGCGASIATVVHYFKSKSDKNKIEQNNN